MTTFPHTLRELASRVSDGIHVQMLWSKEDDRVRVAVADTRTGEAFTVDVHDGERAMDVFHHPFAYAAWRGLTTEASVAVA